AAPIPRPAGPDGYLLAVGRNGDRANPARSLCDAGQFLSFGAVPGADGAVAAGGVDHLAVRTEGDRGERLLIIGAPQRSPVGQPVHLPDVDRGLEARGGDPLAVG